MLLRSDERPPKKDLGDHLWVSQAAELFGANPRLGALTCSVRSEPRGVGGVTSAPPCRGGNLPHRSFSRLDAREEQRALLDAVEHRRRPRMTDPTNTATYARQRKIWRVVA